MQAELDAEGLNVSVRIIGVNEIGHESGNADFTDGRDLAWLQETQDDRVWDVWGVTYRDVIILGGDNSVRAVFNLTTQDLEEQANYDELKSLFIEAAANP